MPEFARPTRRPSPARSQRRRAAIDLAVAAALAAVFLIAAGGLGIVAWFGVPILLLGLLSVAIEALLRRRRTRRRASTAQGQRP